jgi:hypothetical protein
MGKNTRERMEGDKDTKAMDERNNGGEVRGRGTNGEQMK